MKSKIIAATLVVAAACAFAADNGRSRSLFERLGGMPAIEAVADKLFTRIVADDRVNTWFAHAAAHPESALHYKKSLAELVCQATGGPCKYSGPDMAAVHQGRGVTEAAFNAVVEDIAATLDELKVPEKQKSQLLALLTPMKAAVVQQ
jgi:hemoglobin